MKPRLAIVSSHKASCANSYYADALQNFLRGSFDVEIIDLKTYELLAQKGESYREESERYIDFLCEKLAEFDVVNIHWEFGLFGSTVEDTVRRICRLCQASKRLIITMHKIDVGGDFETPIRIILDYIKKRPASNPYHFLVHLDREKKIMENIFEIQHVTDFPVIFLNNERREQFRKLRNPSQWKKQFGLTGQDKTIGVFGLLTSYKNYPHALKTLKLLPEEYKLLIIGALPPLNVVPGGVDPDLQELLDLIDLSPEISHRVIFTGKRDDRAFNEDLVNVDFVLLPYFEVGQSASAALSNALELCCQILMSNTFNCREYQKYYPNCFETFDIGNYHETKHKILYFEEKKVDNLKNQLDKYSEVQIRELYETIYESMKSLDPVTLPSTLPNLKALASPQWPASIRYLLKPIKKLTSKA